MATILVRDAEATDAEVALHVLRRSITELCVDDHHDDPATLEHWLSNKTGDYFARWLTNPDLALLVAELDGTVRAVGNVGRAGRIFLCYVEPGFERLGLGAALLAELEARAVAWGLSELTLESSSAARAFYARHGYETAGPAVPGFVIARSYPFKKALRLNS